MSKEKIGVLVMSYGTPQSMEQVEEYYTHIRRGHPPTPEQLNELKGRYEAIGGLFPLRANTDRQVRALEEYLNQQSEDVEFVCYQGLKHARPYIEDGIEQMVKDGIKRAVSVVLAPHYSVMSVGSYNQRAKDAAEQHGISISCVHEYHLHPSLLEALTERVEEGLSRFPIEKDEVRVIFSAHSLPERILKMKDPYVDQLLATSKAVAERAGTNNWQFAWQSAGQTWEPWLGPDILDVLETIQKKEHVQHVLICPVGFVSDHLEVLYDIDIECVEKGKELGMNIQRTISLNTDPKYIQTLADVVLQQLENRGWRS